MPLILIILVLISFSTWAQAKEIEYIKHLSPNVQLADLTIQTSFPYKIQSQCSLDENEIITNLSMLSLKVVEPVYKMFDKQRVRINSAFRLDKSSSCDSQHNLGQAIDIQFRDNPSNSTYFKRAKKIIANIEFDQFILEYKHRPLYHISYSSSKNRKQVLTEIRPGIFVRGLIFKNDF